jgi:acetyl coenzyme A synthetase (ADP forming)-like protein
MARLLASTLGFREDTFLMRLHHDAVRDKREPVAASMARKRPSPERPRYPAEEERDVVLRTGSTLRLRPIRSEDADALLALYRRLSPDSLYFRFFALPNIDAQRAAGFCRVDYDDAFAVVGETAGRIAAVAHYFRLPQHPEVAEVAFTVEDALQGQGVGTRLLERLAEIARSRGITTFEAEVLGHNRRMLDVFRNCGFAITQRRAEGGVERVRLELAPSASYEEHAAERSARAAFASMRKLFEPGVVAVVGASRQRGKIGAEIFHNLKERFRGTAVPVNPSAGEVFGAKSYPRVTDIPGPVDLAVISVPAELVEPAVDDCIAKGVSSVVVITAGFSETGAEGRRREAQLLEKVRAAGIRMVGPNCMGIVNTDPRFQLNATFGPIYPPEGKVALSSQSGALGLALLDYASKLNLGISTFVSAGNKADVSGNDLIQYWAEDPRTEVILLYLESFGNPVRFGRIARRVARSKPIVAVKSGRSQAGSRAASSHTGALAESDRVVDALLRQAGVIRTGTLEELFDVAMLLANQPVPAGRRVAILTNAGGPGILAADACEAQGLELPALSPKTAAALRDFLPAAASVGNPVDMLASAPAEHYRLAERILLADDAIDSLLVIFIPPLAANADEVASAILEGSAGSRKPVLATFMSAKGAPPGLAPLPCYPFPESAVIALARAAAYGEWKRRPAGRVPALRDVDASRARAVIERALARGGGWLGPVETEELLTAFGIAAVPLRLARTAAEAAAAASGLGFPVAVKAVGPAILHKTEVGGVRLGLANEADVAAAARDLKKQLGDDLTDFLIQPMVPGGVEVIAGVTNDPTFGPLVLYGSGGTLVELMADVAFRLQPLTDADVDSMLDEVRGSALLRGYRGAPKLDESALKDLLLRLSLLVETCPEVREMDLNPVKVLPRGVRVLDARVRVERRRPAPPSRRIAY